MFRSNAHRDLRRVAEAESPDLIVMGAQGRGGMGLALFGSTTQQIVRRATCPVLTVRGVATDNTLLVSRGTTPHWGRSPWFSEVQRRVEPSCATIRPSTVTALKEAAISVLKRRGIDQRRLRNGKAEPTLGAYDHS